MIYDISKNINAPFIQEIKELLVAVKEDNPNFSGIGIIVSDDIASLPIYPLRKLIPLMPFSNPIEFLREISSYGSGYHDGFHILDSELQLKKISQYFSPPIPDHFILTRETNFGGRYLAALFGSTLKSVKLTAINSNNSGLSIFENGVEIYSQGAVND